jgi:hypothetical protein
MLRSIRKPLLAAGFALTVVAVPALAQQPVTYPAACDASKVSKGDVDRAHTVYLSGKQYLDESNYDKAISYFTDAYSIDCSVHAILPIIATAYERKGDKGEAVRALEEYLRRVPNSSDREHIERRIKNLNDQLAHEQPSSTAAGQASAPPPVASVAPVPSATAEPSAPATAAPPPAADTGSRSVGPAPWIVTGVGGAAIAAGVVLSVVGAGKISSAEDACGGSRSGCSDAVASKGNSGRTLETVGVVVGVAGVVAAGAGIIWGLTAKPSSAGASGAAIDQPRRWARPVVTPVLAPGYAGLALSSPL